MKKQMVLSTVAAVGALSVLLSLPVRQAGAQTVFQAAGPDVASIQSTVDAYRAALGNPNNLNQARSALRIPPSVAERSTGTAPGQLDRHDGPGHTVRHVPEHSRGPVHHAGDGPFAGSPSGGPQGGLPLFDNPTYATSSAPSALRACSRR